MSPWSRSRLSRYIWSWTKNSVLLGCGPNRESSNNWKTRWMWSRSLQVFNCIWFYSYKFPTLWMPICIGCSCCSWRRTDCWPVFGFKWVQGLFLFNFPVHRVASSSVDDFLRDSKGRNEFGESQYQRLPNHVKLSLQEGIYYAVEHSRPEIALTIKNKGSFW